MRASDFSLIPLDKPSSFWYNTRMENDSNLAWLIADNINECTEEERSAFFYSLLGRAVVQAPDILIRTAKQQTKELTKKLTKPLDETA